jgi:hypothetical protein
MEQTQSLALHCKTLPQQTKTKTRKQTKDLPKFFFHSISSLLSYICIFIYVKCYIIGFKSEDFIDNHTASFIWLVLAEKSAKKERESRGNEASHNTGL